MAIKMIKVKCPECGGTMDIEQNRDMAYCTYCGTKILIHNENEKIYRRIDEARIRETETERLIRLKELELLEKEQEDKRKRARAKIKWSLLLGTIGILMFIIGYALGESTGDSDSMFYMIGFMGLFPLMAAFGMWGSLSEKK